MRVIGIFDIFTGDAAEEAAAKNAALYQQYGQQATQALDTALPKSTGAIESAIGAFTPLADLGKRLSGGTNLYLNALGVNGPEGTAAARSAFTTSPGYEFARDEATNAAQRAINRFSPGGNEADAIARVAGGVASKEYGDWLTRLGVLVPQEASAVGDTARGRAAGYGALGSLYQTDALNRSNIFGNVAGGTANSNTQAANAEMSGSSNFWNGLLSLGGSFAGAAFPVPKKTA